MLRKEADVGLIDAGLLKQAMYNRAFETDGDTIWMSGCWVRYKAIERVISEQPTVETEPVKHGKWKWLSCTYDRVPCEKEYLCSECNHKTVTHGDGLPWEKYCPNCGARMDEE